MIDIKNATMIYDNGVKGIQDISMHINKDEFVFVVGSSGSGKSTIMRLLMKEIELTQGEIHIASHNLAEITRKNLPAFRRKMGVVFQDFRLLPNKTVYENVAFAMQVTEYSGREIRKNVPAVLALVGLQRKSKSYPHQLSGGEQQRCAIARAIVNRPPLLLADEPTGNLDPDTAWEIMEILSDINTRNTTVVMATHAKEIVDRMRKRVITLQGGRLIRDMENGGYSNEA